jgi:hypothetical protein
MENNFYLPILKSKSGEFIALSKLGQRAKKKIVPLFEITPLEWDHTERKKPKTLEDHIQSFCKKFLTKWDSENCFIDTSLLNHNGKDNTHKIEDILQVLHAKGIFPLPMLHMDPSVEFIRALKRTYDIIGIDEVGLRVNMDNVISEHFKEDVTILLSQLEINPSQVHFILDLKDSKFDEAENFAAGLLDLFDGLPFFQFWKSFTLAGTSFPESGKIKEGLWQFERNEWKLYKIISQELSLKDYNRTINYGDYSIVNPEYFEFDPRTMKSSANIRYTHNGKWIVAKGHALKNSEDYRQYKELAKSIYNTPFYLGEGFSAGSLYIAQCIRGEVTNGNPNTWIWVGNNHHFTKVLFDQFSILPGT